MYDSIDIMSSRPYGDPSTRLRILDAALDLSVRLGPSMRLSDVARAAGVSHQGLYLHFKGRDALLLALLEHMVTSFGLRELSDAVVGAPDGRMAVRRIVEFMYQLDSRLSEIGWLLEEAQHLDEAFGDDWRNRTRGLQGFIHDHVTGRLAADGLLRNPWVADDAADLILGLTDLGTWRTYVRDLGWSESDYTSKVTAMILSAIT